MISKLFASALSLPTSDLIHDSPMCVPASEYVKITTQLVEEEMITFLRETLREPQWPLRITVGTLSTDVDDITVRQIRHDDPDTWSMVCFSVVLGSLYFMWNYVDGVKIFDPYLMRLNGEIPLTALRIWRPHPLDGDTETYVSAVSASDDSLVRKVI